MVAMGAGLQRDRITSLLRAACVRVVEERGLGTEIPEPLDDRTELSQVGVDSVLIAEVVDDLETALGVILPYREVLMARTVGELVSLVEAAEA